MKNDNTAAEMVLYFYTKNKFSIIYDTKAKHLSIWRIDFRQTLYQLIHASSLQELVLNKVVLAENWTLTLYVRIDSKIYMNARKPRLSKAILKKNKI
jgi:hypothetical protein